MKNVAYIEDNIVPQLFTTPSKPINFSIEVLFDPKVMTNLKRLGCFGDTQFQPRVHYLLRS